GAEALSRGSRGRQIGANTQSWGLQGTRGNETGSGSKLGSGTLSGPTSWNSSTTFAGLPAGKILSVGARPFTCSSRFSSQIRLGCPNRAEILLKSMMTSIRSATLIRVLVISIGRGSRLPSLAICQNGIDWLGLSG